MTEHVQNIVKALRQCSVDYAELGCDGCPLAFRGSDCTDYARTEAADIIEENDEIIKYAQQIIKRQADVIQKKDDDLRKAIDAAYESGTKDGEWIGHTDCSVCGWYMYDDVCDSKNIVSFKYCPNCGAKMKPTNWRKVFEKRT